MQTETIIGAQGEVRIYRLNTLPDGVGPANVERTAKGSIISHSESGHHHVLAGDFDLMEAPDVLPGMKILYAILKSPCALVQDAPNPHGGYAFQAGDILKFEMDIEFNPFLEQARQSAD